MEYFLCTCHRTCFIFIIAFTQQAVYITRMRSTLLKQQLVQVRYHLAMGEIETLAELYPEYERTFLEFCAAMGWHPRIEHEWIKEAEGKRAEVLFADASVGIANLLYVTKQDGDQKKCYEQAASRWLTYIRITHARVFSQLDVPDTPVVLSNAVQHRPDAAFAETAQVALANA